MRTPAVLCFIACSFLLACSGSREDGLGRQGLRDAEMEADAAPDAGDGEDAAVDMLDGSDPGGEDADVVAEDAGADAAVDDAGDADAEVARVQAYVNADIGDDSNDGSSNAPLKTLGRAFEVVGENGLVWMQPSTFTNATEGLAGEDTFRGRSAPSDTHLRSTGPGVVLGVTVAFPAGGRLEDATFEASGGGRVLITGGEVVLHKPVWIKSLANGLDFAIQTSGSARVTVTAGGDAEHNYVGAPGALNAFAAVRGQSTLTIEGGVIDGATGAGFGNLIDLADATALTLSNLTISNESSVWVSGGSVVWMGGPETSVTIDDSRIDLNDGGNAACLVQDDNYGGTTSVDADLTIRRSVLTRCPGGALQLREGAPRVRVEESELSESGRFGIESGRIGFDGVKVAGQPLITLVDSTIRGNYLGGIAMNAGGTLTVQGGSLRDNGEAGATRGGIWLDGVFPYALQLRGVSVIDNAGIGAWAGLLLLGDASSSFDLGSAASPGNNTFTGNVSTQLRLQVAAGVLVSAVGNTWPASTQGSEADGRYTLAGALCGGADPCDQTSGEGTNFSFMGAGAGARLRLAD